jgi:hypothetical protein
MITLKGGIVAITSIALLIEGVVILTMGDFSPARPIRSAGVEAPAENRSPREERDPTVPNPLRDPPVAYLGVAEPSNEGPPPSSAARPTDPSLPQLGSEPDRALELDRRAASETIVPSRGQLTPPEPSSEVAASSDNSDPKGQGKDSGIEQTPLASPPQPVKSEVSGRPTIIAKAQEQVEDRRHAARESVAQQATADYYLGADAESDRDLGPIRSAPAIAAVSPDQPKLSSTEEETKRTAILGTVDATKDTDAAAAMIEDRLQAARQKIAEQTSAGLEIERRLETARIAAERQKALQAAVDAAAAEQARLAQIEADRQASIALAQRQAQEKERIVSIAKLEVAVENRLHAARETLAVQKTAADAAATEQARLAQIEADRQASIALAQKQAQERLASIAKVEAAVENRLHAAREMIAAQKTAADAAAAEQARLAQIETDRQASLALAQKQAQDKERIVSIAKVEAGVENRLHAARETLAMQKTAADVVAAAEQARLAQIETDRRASLALAQKQAQERLALIAKVEAGVENRLHAAREKSYGQVAAGVEIERLAGASSTAAESQKALKAGANVALQSAGAASSPVSQPISTGSIAQSSVDIARQKNPLLARREVDSLSRSAPGRQAEAARTHKVSPSSLNGTGQRTGWSRVAVVESPLAPSVNRSEDVLVFQRRCPSILDSSLEYDEALVALCRGWAAKK